MEQSVTGCKDCPYFLPEGAHYNFACGHPKSPVKYGIWDNGNFIELPYQIVPDNLYQADGYSVSFRTEPLEIKESKEFEPITPDWCPLNKEPITIIKQP